MKFNDCITFLKELNRFDNIHIIIESNESSLYDTLFDDVTIADLSPFEGKDYDLSFDGLHNDNVADPIFKMIEV